jgi:predicted Zn-dependent protease
MPALVLPLIVLLGQTPAAEGVSVSAPAPTSPADEAHKLVEEGPNTPKVLTSALAHYETALKSGALDDKRRALVLTDMARARLRLGDLATQKKAKITQYEAGRALAVRAQQVDPKLADAYFWEAANLAVIGRTNGVTSSLFMLGDLKKKLYKTLELDPQHHLARETIGSIYAAVPGLLGGDDDRAEQHFKDVLKRDPHFTATHLTYAHFLIERDRKAEARKHLLAVVNERRPSMPHDHKKFTLPDAKKALKELD